ncbi:competence/damage-inducible protein A [Alkalicoccus luteus]|uniref:Putative competence-damage inducible protein n=1 Tax=Alkalicoccus luteus TaxID=1237094 RepID=A0A969PLA5_9BACI|nr:competence/damage-inducible protein A [Alkalicoccus luteus]NJP36290.1 competence/damage-inducible protein A [Alkalicoccus luteus]
MNAEIIAVGTELLLGQIDDTNATFISRQLSEAGINVYFRQTAGDNEERLKNVIQTASERSDIVILTGGLGPTRDDLTRDALASFTGLPLKADEESLEKLKVFFESRGRELTEFNKKQALTLEGADVLPNDEGLACGSFLEHQGKKFLLLPGPPREMRTMFTQYALPKLRSGMEEQQIQSEVLRFYEIGESLLTEKLDDLIENQTNPTIAPLASEGEVALRLTVRGPSKETNEEMLYELKQKIFAEVGDYCYGEGDSQIEQVTAELLREQEKSISAAESLTGGMFADTMTSFSGASMIFPGGIVCYSNEAKIQTLGISEKLLEEHGAVSAECAEAMADGCRRVFSSDYGISFTGAAGPDPLEGYEPGQMFIGIATPEKTVSHFVNIGGSRNRIRTYAVKQGLYLLFQELRNKKGG